MAFGSLNFGFHFKHLFDQLTEEERDRTKILELSLTFSVNKTVLGKSKLTFSIHSKCLDITLGYLYPYLRPAFQ